MFPTRSTQTPVEVVAQSALTQQVEQFERKLVEQQRKDKEQRQSEQIKMQVQLKDFQQQLFQQQKRDFEFQQQEQQQIQHQVQVYQQKLTREGCQQVQQQVREYERMFVQNQQQETDKRQRVHFHLQQKLEEAERMLSQQQQMEFQHLIHNKETLKAIQHQAAAGIMGQHTGSQMWAEKSQVLEQQTQEEKCLKQKQEHLHKLVKEIESELNVRDIEQQKREVTGHLRTYQVQQKVQQAEQIKHAQQQLQCGVEGSQFFQSAKVEQIQQLEQQLSEYKRILRQKIQQQQQQGVNGQVESTMTTIPTVFTVGVQQQIQQALTQQWIQQLVQKLRGIQSQIYAAPGTFAQKKMQQLKQHIMFFEQQLEQQQGQYSTQCVSQLMNLKNFVQNDFQSEIQQQQVAQQFAGLITGQQQYTTIKQLTGELVQHLSQVVPCEMLYSAMPVEKLFSKLRSMEYRLRELRQFGEIEPQYVNIYTKMFQIEQQLAQPQYFIQQQQQQQTVTVNGVQIPMTVGINGTVVGMQTIQQQQQLEFIQEQAQQLEYLIQEAVVAQRQTPYKLQVTKYQQSKHLIKRLVQLIDEVECQVAEIKIQQHNQQQVACQITGQLTGQQQIQAIQYQTQMVLRQLRGLRSQLKCVLQQLNLVAMHHKMQQLVASYECQLGNQQLTGECRSYHGQVQAIMTVLKGLEQQLIEQHLQSYTQQYQQVSGYYYGGFNTEDVFEQIQQQMGSQQILQQAIKEFATLLVQQKQPTQVPIQVRLAIQQTLMHQVREFECMLGQYTEVVADQEQYLNYSAINGQQQHFFQQTVPQQFVQQYQGQHIQFQTLFKQLQQVLIQTQQQIQQQTTVCQQFGGLTTQQLVSALIQQVQQIQQQHQQQQYQQITGINGQIMPQQYPQYLWCIQQQQKPCYAQLVQQLVQLQQLQSLPVGDLLQQQQYYVLFKQIQKELQQLNAIQQQYQRSNLWKNWTQWNATNVPQLQQQLQQLRQQQMPLRQIQQQLQEIVQQQLQQQGLSGARMLTTVTPFGSLVQLPFGQQTPFGSMVQLPGLQQQVQMTKSISQQSGLTGAWEQQQQQVVEQVAAEQQLTGGALDANNNIFSSWCVVEPSTILELCNADDFIVNFFTAGSQVEQEKIVGDLIQKYLETMQYTGSECNQTFRQKFEQMYFENNNLGQQLRQQVQLNAQLRNHFNGLTTQTTTTYKGCTIPQGGKYSTKNFGITMPFGPSFRQQQRQTGIMTPSTTFGQQIQTPFGDNYESLIALDVENPVCSIMPQQFGQQVQQPTLRTVEKMLNNLENKLTQLRLEEQYPCIQIGGPVNPVPMVGSGYGAYQQAIREQFQEPIQILTNGQQQEQHTVVEVIKKNQNGQQLTSTQIFSECKICPVCGIAVEKELSQPEFELHVNSHFPFAE